jgi:hypothetical protein
MLFAWLPPRLCMQRDTGLRTIGAFREDNTQRKTYFVGARELIAKVGFNEQYTNKPHFQGA